MSESPNDGAVVLIALLCDDANVTAMVPPDADPPRITEDVLAQGTTLPALRVHTVSNTDTNISAPGPRRWVRQRVQVDCHGGTKPEAKALRQAVRRALADRRIDQFEDLTIIRINTAGRGPDGFDPDTGARVATQDFFVSYNEER